MPSLLLQGSVLFKLDGSSLYEAIELVNFNPSGAPSPWPTGTTNSTITDSYSPTLRGLMYVTGNVTFGDDHSIGQLICAGWINTSGKTVWLNYTPDYINNPPPGFYDVDMTASSMTWTQLTN
jgi:hypothetical protein